MSQPNPLEDFTKHLRCPRTGDSLGIYTKDQEMYLVTQSQQYAYEIIDGIPVLLPTAAFTWPELEIVED
ncbi:Trm112 family protein [Boudabousia marimammalium]|uniref:Uncharacterized protein n=1 Tax=Boudabousia marimammalium TaxID=156892 RepID=A0A1Q5PS20_9ACTO|nr:hypothetical protein [Boudabousia marimammalium]OKL50210.1 hypothetical protein BM477_02110 [Boudabousia marimammalium]